MERGEGNKSLRGKPCAACKQQRKKCEEDCVFAPYFLAESQQRFAMLPHVYGTSNVGNILKELDVSQREEAMKTLAYQAEAHVRDPVHGCMGFIYNLEEKLEKRKMDVQRAKLELAKYISPEKISEFMQNEAQHNQP
ncbi:hypothetical protein RJT34_30676 [Clitoria ternatea]|uniref:LOB domain-containing protein n=1 Tax=Clitoria ternatea TaxID=43366 RepID=A0AAN9I275_CLITE